MSTIIAGRRLRALRREARLSQDELARAAGVSRQALGAFEAGKTAPSLQTALALARTLGRTVEELFAGDDSSGPPGDGPAGARVALATIAGRLVARALGPGGAQPWLGRADGIAPLTSPGETTGTTTFVSGCDPALGLLAAYVRGAAVWFDTNNTNALAELARGEAHAAAVHVGGEAELEALLDAAGLRGAVSLFDLAAVEEGWLVAAGNPLHLRGARDLARKHARIANRPRGAAARALLETECARCGIDGATLDGYGREMRAQLDVAAALANGFADAAIGLASLAPAYGLDFLPLRREQTLLVMPRSVPNSALLEALRDSAFRRELAALGPYDTSLTGEPHR